MKLQVDLRKLENAVFHEAVKRLPSGVYLLMTAWQWAQLKGKADSSVDAGKVTIVAPDFLYYARLAGTGQPAQILRLPESAGAVAGAAIASIPLGVSRFPGLLRQEFWPAAEAMLSYDLGLLGRNFPGEILLHDSLTDFACFFERADIVDRFAKRIQRAGRKPENRWGFATQQLAKLLSICAQRQMTPARLLIPTGTTRPEDTLVAAIRRDFSPSPKLTVDMTQWPHEILGAADLYEFPRPTDDTWLVSYEAVLALGI